MVCSREVVDERRTQLVSGRVLPQGPAGRGSAAVTRALIVLVEQAVEHGARRRHAREQRRARPQFEVVRRTKDLRRRSALDAEGRLPAFQQPRSEDRVFEVRPGLLDALDRVVLRGWTERQPVELRKDVPHPMRALSAADDFRQRPFVVPFLRSHEPAQVVRVAAALSVVPGGHTRQARV